MTVESIVWFARRLAHIIHDESQKHKKGPVLAGECALKDALWLELSRQAACERQFGSFDASVQRFRALAGTPSPESGSKQGIEVGRATLTQGTGVRGASPGCVPAPAPTPR